MEGQEKRPSLVGGDVHANMPPSVSSACGPVGSVYLCDCVSVAHHVCPCVCLCVHLYPCVCIHLGARGPEGQQGQGWVWSPKATEAERVMSWAEPRGSGPQKDMAVRAEVTRAALWATDWRNTAGVNQPGWPRGPCGLAPGPGPVAAAPGREGPQLSPCQELGGAGGQSTCRPPSLPAYGPRVDSA